MENKDDVLAKHSTTYISVISDNTFSTLGERSKDQTLSQNNKLLSCVSLLADER